MIQLFKIEINLRDKLIVSCLIFSISWIVSHFFYNDVTIIRVACQIYRLVDNVSNHFELGFSSMKLFPQKFKLSFFDLILDLKLVGRIWSFRVLLSCFHHNIKWCFTFVRCNLRLCWLKLFKRIGLWGWGQVNYQICWSIRHFVFRHVIVTFFFLRLWNRYLFWLRILLCLWKGYLFRCFELGINQLLVVCYNGIFVGVVQCFVAHAIQLFITGLCCFPSRICLWHCINNILEDIIMISWSFVFVRIQFQPIVDRNSDKSLVNIVRFSLKKVSYEGFRLLFLLNKCLVDYEKLTSCTFAIGISFGMLNWLRFS